MQALGLRQEIFLKNCFKWLGLLKLRLATSYVVSKGCKLVGVVVIF